MCISFEKIYEKWKRYKNNELCWPFKIIDFIWRKEYKILLWLIFIIGVCFIIDADLNISEKILSVIYFSTAVIIFWYTRETYDLKVIQRKELEEVRKQTDFEMRPYLRLQWSDNRFEIFQIVNCGRGIAIDVKFEKFKIKFQEHELNIKIKNRPLISPGNVGCTTVKGAELVDSIKSQASELKLDQYNIKDIIKANLNRGFEIKTSYKDIIDNKYQAVFQSDLSYNDRFKIKNQIKLKPF